MKLAPGPFIPLIVKLHLLAHLRRLVALPPQMYTRKQDEAQAGCCYYPSIKKPCLLIAFRKGVESFATVQTYGTAKPMGSLEPS